MTELHFWKTLQNIFAKRRTIPDNVGPPATTGRPSIFVDELRFRDGTALRLKKNSIVVITGPNNSGKSSVLHDIDVALSEGKPTGPVVSKVTFKTKGTISDFRAVIEDRAFTGNDAAYVMVSRFKVYRLEDLEKDFKSGFVGSKVSELFYSRLNAAARLGLVDPIGRNDWTSRPPDTPLQWLDFEFEAEDQISAAFKSAFGLSVVVNRTAGEKIMLHVCDGDLPEFDDFRDYRKWLSNLPSLESQGDGMKSFAAALLGIKIHPKSMILLDEPEAFLHAPQAYKLSEIITTGASEETQIWIATHSDDVVRGLLNNATDRNVIVRLDRRGNTTIAHVLDADEVKILWADPLLRTTDVLSALFHEIAVICEGESDVRFFRTLIDANKTSERLPDLRFYHVGGKDKIMTIVSALRALNVPVCAMCDLDVMSEKEKFLSLFKALGGDASAITADVDQITQHVRQRSTEMSGEEAARKLRAIADEMESEARVSSARRREISAVAKENSTWARLKADGYRGFGNAVIVQAFERVYVACRSIGLLINREGELEGLCRDSPQEPTSAWLADVLARNLATDPSLEDARKMLEELRISIRAVRQTAFEHLGARST